MKRAFSVGVFSVLLFCGVVTLNAQTIKDKHTETKDFVNYAMGIQYAIGNGIPFGATGGVQFGLGYGRWMNSLLGVRFSGEMATSHLNAHKDLLLKSARLGGRVDMLLNPLAFGKSYTPGRFGTALLLGWELGAKVDAMYSHLDFHA
ncbi:MAG: hypothetical protein IIX62_05370, partial [Peptococcaceae bacterium]|nr:hypothetical protein [Peptococcaceae bacterium]